MLPHSLFYTLNMYLSRCLFELLKFWIEKLYFCRPGSRPRGAEPHIHPSPKHYEPKSKVASLQAIFVVMQYNKRKYADPTDFICNPSVQQELSKLFVSLETSLEHQFYPGMRCMV